LEIKKVYWQKCLLTNYFLNLFGGSSSSELESELNAYFFLIFFIAWDDEGWLSGLAMVVRPVGFFGKYADVIGLDAVF